MIAHVSHDQCRVQVVADDDRAECVELEVALRATHLYRDVGTHDLDADHEHCLGLSRVDLARHDRRAWFVCGQDQLLQACARAGSEPAQVVCNLVQRNGCRLERGVRANHPVQRSLRSELVLGSLDFEAGQLGQFGRHLVAEADGRVEPSADCGSTHRDFEHPFSRVLKVRNRIIECTYVAGPLLADR